jgi:hypothetical protein
MSAPKRLDPADGSTPFPVCRFVLSVTSTPQKIDDALSASLRTLRSVATQRVSQVSFRRDRFPRVKIQDTGSLYKRTLPPAPK